MKKLLIIVTIIIVMGFSITACEDGDNGEATINYTVIFNADNGIENTSQTITEGSKANKPENPEKSDFNFIYWFNEDTGTEWDFNTIITSNVTLKAKWAPDGKTRERAIPLSYNDWTEGTGNQWFYFTAIATTQYIHIDCGTAIYPGFSVYDSENNIIQSISYVYSGGFASRDVIIDQVYYINMSQVDGNDTFIITFNDSTIPPAVTLPDNGIIQLNHNTWNDGEFTSDGSNTMVQWYNFTAASDMEFFHCTSFNENGNRLGIRIYNHDGISIENGNIIHYAASFSKNVVSGQLYYIKIWSSMGTGSFTYRIAYNSSNTQPPITLPTENVTQLVLNTWTNGEIVDVGEIKWYKFIATSDTQYIHTNDSDGIMHQGNVQFFDSNGIRTGDLESIMWFPGSFSRLVTIGNEYYICVFESHPGLRGEFQIAFTESNLPPSIILPSENINHLLEDIWFDGEIISSGRQWFSFTASADTYYNSMHFIFNPPVFNLGIKVYDANGIMVYGSSTGVGNKLTYIPVIYGNVYYFEVWLPSWIVNGTYQVAFNTSSMPPPLE
ncbi:MAG: InlB B-repeat-containing protein [Treponema sp.]|nr:InlB B-repeat-containing protein [Treponema sp.]